MFSKDSSGKATARFGGFEFVPSSTLVRGYGQKTAQPAAVLDNSAKYNDYVPMVYGTGWVAAPVILARNDGNLTHMELLLGSGSIDSVLKVIVNDIEIPLAASGTDMTGTGWYNIVTPGTAQGSFNLDFVDSDNQPVGDPYGSVAVISVVVPNRISSGGSLPHVEILMQGLHLDPLQPGCEFSGYYVYKQSGLDHSGYSAARGLVSERHQHRELRERGRVLRRADRDNRHQWQCNPYCPISMQPDSNETQERGGRNPERPCRVRFNAAIWRKRATGTATGNFARITASDTARWKQCCGKCEWGLARL